MPKNHMTLCEVYISVPMPRALVGALRQIAERDCLSLAGTIRRLVAHGITRELSARDHRGQDNTPRQDDKKR